MIVVASKWINFLFCIFSNGYTEQEINGENDWNDVRLKSNRNTIKRALFNVCVCVCVFRLFFLNFWNWTDIERENNKLKQSFKFAKT